MKVKHGVIGLLKHIVFTAPARSSLSWAGIVKRLVKSNIIQPTSDMAEMVGSTPPELQNTLCSSNVYH